MSAKLFHINQNTKVVLEKDGKPMILLYRNSSLTATLRKVFRKHGNVRIVSAGRYPKEKLETLARL